MADILFANANSLFDHTSGSSKSIRLILQKLSAIGNNVYAVTGCTSDSYEGYKASTRIWNQSKEKEEHNNNNFITRFNYNGIKYSFIKTRNWQRNLLTADESENIYRESLGVINECKIKLLISWGNLLLEEAIFKKAKESNIKLCFYLVNPTYKGRKIYLFDHADLVITDSLATKSLYSNEIKCKTFIIPKALDNDFNFDQSNSEDNDSKFEKNCLFVNPSLNKGLEAALTLSKYLEKYDPQVRLIFVDARGNLKSNLKYLGFDTSELPKNIIVTSGYEQTNELFKNIKLLLLLSIWHESGSRLILESYSRGIPVIAFNSGGNSELMSGYKNDIFPMPTIISDANKILRISQWDPTDMAKRISLLLKDPIQYNLISEKIYSNNLTTKQNMRCEKKLNELIKTIDEN